MRQIRVKSIEVDANDVVTAVVIAETLIRRLEQKPKAMMNVVKHHTDY